MYIRMSLSNRVVRDHDCFMLMIIYMYACMSLSGRVIRDHACGGMIAYACEWHEVVLGL